MGKMGAITEFTDKSLQLFVFNCMTVSCHTVIYWQNIPVYSIYTHISVCMSVCSQRGLNVLVIALIHGCSCCPPLPFLPYFYHTCHLQEQQRTNPVTTRCPVLRSLLSMPPQRQNQRLWTYRYIITANNVKTNFTN